MLGQYFIVHVVYVNNLTFENSSNVVLISSIKLYFIVINENIILLLQLKPAALTQLFCQ
jgi:hypothetical protein